MMLRPQRRFGLFLVCLLAVFTGANQGCSADSPAQRQGSPQTAPASNSATAPAADTPPGKQTTGLPRETGLASFIADKFSGRKTASGEPYDNTSLVAAHPSYPMGTLVRVTNRANARTVEVRIIDRSASGPQRPIIDLSRAAAARLDFLKQGTATVTTEVLQWGAGDDGKHR